MKMSDIFDMPVRSSQLEVYGANSNEGISFEEIEIAAAFAINNHDRLTEENTKLREVLEKLVNQDNCKKDIIHIIGNAESLLSQLKDGSQ